MEQQATSWYPQNNDQAESLNKTIIKILKKASWKPMKNER